VSGELVQSNRDTAMPPTQSDSPTRLDGAFVLNIFGTRIHNPRSPCIAYPPVSPPPGLPRCRRPHRTHFQAGRWSIRVNRLRRAASRVRHNLPSPSSSSPMPIGRQRKPMLATAKPHTVAGRFSPLDPKLSLMIHSPRNFLIS